MRLVRCRSLDDARKPPPDALVAAPHEARLASPRALRTIQVRRATLEGGVSSYLGALARGLFRFMVWFFAGSLEIGVAPGQSYRMRGARALQAAPLIRVLLVLGLLVVWRWGLTNPATALAMLGGAFAFGAVFFLIRAHARARLLLVATRPTESAPALQGSSVSAPFLLDARPLQELALGLDRLRRGDAPGAAAAISGLDEARLEGDEQRLLWATRALIADTTGDKKHAQLTAVTAFPTGAEEIDGALAALLIDGALHDGTRLTALLESFEAHGVRANDDSHVGRSFRFALVKLARLAPSALPAGERSAAIARAQAHGDRELEARLVRGAAEKADYRA